MICVVSLRPDSTIAAIAAKYGDRGRQLDGHDPCAESEGRASARLLARAERAATRVRRARAAAAGSAAPPAKSSIRCTVCGLGSSRERGAAGRDRT